MTESADLPPRGVSRRDAPHEPAAPQVTDAIVSVEEQFRLLYTRAKAGMRDRAARVHPDLQPLGFTVLSALLHSGPTHIGAIAEELSLDKSIMSRQARQLEQLGLVSRQADPNDRRAAFLAATPDAERRVAAVRLADQGRLHASLADWRLDDLEKLVELLARLNGIRP